MKTIAFFGATGKTGQALTEILQNNPEYKVKALIRKNNFDKNFSNFEFIVGDILNKNDVLKTISGCDFVISVIGHNKNSPKDLQTEAIKNIIEVMKENNINRIISLTGTGVRIPNDKKTFTDSLLNFIIEKVDPNRIRDGKNHAVFLQQSNLNWTIVRVLKLTNQDKINNYKLTEHGPARIFISRKSIAQIIIDLLDKENWFKKMPIIS